MTLTRRLTSVRDPAGILEELDLRELHLKMTAPPRPPNARFANVRCNDRHIYRGQHPAECENHVPHATRRRPVQMVQGKLSSSESFCSRRVDIRALMMRRLSSSVMIPAGENPNLVIKN